MRAFRPLSFMIAAVLIQIPCVAAEQIRTIPVIAIRMVYAKTRHELYLSVPEVSTNYPNSVTVVDSATLSVKKSLPFESVPTFLALSEDETYLYVTLSGGYVTRIDLDRFTRDLTFSTVDTEVEGLRSITDIRVFPDNPHSVVVAVDQQGSDPVLAVYDDGVMRPKKTPRGLGVRSFTFGADPSTIWGHQSTSDRFALYHLQVDGEGISVLDEGVLGLVIGWFENPRFWKGRLYSVHGRVSDPAKRTMWGRFYSFETVFAGSYDFDAERNRIYFPLRSGYDFSLAEFDMETFRLVGYYRSYYGNVSVPFSPETSVVVDSRYLAMSGFGEEYQWTVFFPLSLLEPAEHWTRPAPVPMSTAMRRIPLPNNRIVHDPYHDRIYASLSNWDYDIGNSVVPIDPVRGTVGDPVWVGPDPWQMAVSDQGTYLYTALYNGWAVQRLKLPELTRDIRIPISSKNDNPHWGVHISRINEIHPVPGRPESFVAVRAAFPGDPLDMVPQGVAIYDEAVPRSKATPEWPFDGYDSSGIYSVQWSSDQSVLFGTSVFRKLGISEEGIELLDSSHGVIRQQSQTDYIQCQYDFCFGTGGEIVDAASLELLGRFAVDLKSPDFAWPRFVLPDLDRGLVYFLTRFRNGLYLEAFDVVSQHRLSRLHLGTSANPTGLVVWEGDQFAVGTDDEVLLFPMSLLHDRGLLPEPVTRLIPAERLVFPMLLELDGAFSGHAVVDPTQTPANLKLSAYIPEDDSFSYPKSPVTIHIDPDGQWARMGAEVFEEPFIGYSWMELAADRPGLKGFFLYRDGEGMDGGVGEKEAARTLFFPRVEIGEGTFRGKSPQSYLFLVNPCGYEVEAYVWLIDQGQSPPYVGRLVVQIPAKGMYYSELGYMYSHFTKYPDAYLKVEVTSRRGGLVGFQLVQIEDPKTTVGFSAIAPSDALTLYSAQLASGPGIFTSLKVLNTSPETRTVVFHAIANSGQELAGAVSIQLGPGETINQDASELFGFPGNRLTVGSLRLECDGPGVVGNVLFGDSENLEFASALPLDGRPFRKAVFGHIANLTDFFTGVALYNPGNEPAAIRLATYSAKGRETGELSFALPPGGRIARLLTELVPPSTGQSDGYVLIESTQALVGQQLFGTNSLTLLSAVPPQVIE